MMRSDKPFLHRGGDRRLGEIQLTVRYVCLRRCLRVLVNACRCGCYGSSENHESKGGGPVVLL
jgi:hypothetical protein